MYYVNWKLIGMIPEIFNVSLREWAKIVGKTAMSVREWRNRKGISVYDLVLTCNWLKVSIANFITTEEEPLIKRKDEYLIAKDSFQEIIFHNEMIGEIYGNGGIVEINKSNFAYKIGVAPNYVDTWIRDPAKIRLTTIIKIMNIFRLNIRQFIEDTNKIIEIPIWDKSDNPSSEFNRIIEKLSLQNKNYQEENEKLKLINERQDRIMLSMSSSIEKLEVENRTYKELAENIKLTHNDSYSTILAEDEIPYQKKSGKIKFDYKLLYSLPQMFGFSKLDFANRFSLSRRFVYNEESDITINKLICICNELHISIFHFWIPEHNNFEIRERSFYEIPAERFVQIKSKMENLKFIFGKYSIFNISLNEVETIKSYASYNRWAMQDKNSTFKVTSMTSICNEFNISPSLFIYDENRKEIPFYIVPQNEKLILHCIDMKKEIVKLTMKNIKLKSKLEKQKSILNKSK